MEPTQVKMAVDLLESKLSRPLVTFLEACTHCGVCSDSCHLYHINQEAIHIPSFKADKLRRFYKRNFTFAGKYLPWLVDARDLTDAEVANWRDAVYQCTMCRRVINCPIGIDNAQIVRTSRGILHALGLGAPTLEEHTQNALDTGGPLRVSKDAFLERIEWFEGEMQDALGDDDFTIPLDKAGAEYLYVPAGLELMKFPRTVMSTLKLLHRAGVDYTLSTVRFDITNYAMFNGDDAAAKTIAERDVDEALRLGVRSVIVSECGHAYRALRWEAPNWFHHALPFQVKDIVELAHQWLREGKLNPKLGDKGPGHGTEPVTYHDPCNMGRNGGLFDEPREVLGVAVADFREMTPNRENNWCCGGGGGMLSMPEYNAARLAGGLKKAEQVRATGAAIVATACANCQFQLGELMTHYQVNARVESVIDLLADALD